MSKITQNEDAFIWIEDHEQLICDEIVRRLSARLFPPSPDLLKQAIGPFLEATLKRGHVEVDVERLPHDTSSYPRQTDNPWPYQDYDTVEDFLREPDGNITATYQSGSGFMAANFDDDFWHSGLSLITENTRLILQEDGAGILALYGASADVMSTDPAILHDFLCDLLNDTIADQCIETDFMAMIHQMSFKDAARAVNSEVYSRIKASEDASSLLERTVAAAKNTVGRA